MTADSITRNVLVAPLNWGLGHATRCIPIIRALEKCGYMPIIASDGIALALLQKEFPHLLALELPSYEIEYAKDAAQFKWKMLQQMPKMIEAVSEEKKRVKKWVTEYNLIGMISDNRLGVFSKKIPAVFITHQLNVLSGNTTWITSRLHQHIIKKYEECWVPDWEEKPNLTGKLGHLKNPHSKIKYIGPLSRMNPKPRPLKYQLMVVLSGPEPQRSILEEKLRELLPNYPGKVVFISGKIAEIQSEETIDNITFYNFMQAAQLEKTFNESEAVLCRSGYTTIMDLVQLGKKAFFIPTPGQYEQEYLAEKLQHDGHFPFATQDDFELSDLDVLKNYNGFSVENPIHWKHLFCLFERKGEL